jgi:hypothetical protein
MCRHSEHRSLCLPSWFVFLLSLLVIVLSLSQTGATTWTHYAIAVAGHQYTIIPTGTIVHLWFCFPSTRFVDVIIVVSST